MQSLETRHPDSAPNDEPPDTQYARMDETKIAPRQDERDAVVSEERETWRSVVVLCGCMMLSGELEVTVSFPSKLTLSLLEVTIMGYD